MNLRASLRLLPLLAITCGSLSAATTLDFPAATCRVQIGGQAIHFPAAKAGQEIMIDGRPALTDERVNTLMRVSWIIAPVEGIGDEYVFVVRRPGQKPKTYSAIFKGGYVSVASEDKLLIEIEN